MPPSTFISGAASRSTLEQSALNDLAKQQLKDDPEVYAQFLATMRAFDDGSLDYTDFQARATTLLDDHPELVAVMRAADPKSPKLPQQSRAIDYVDLVRGKYQNQPKVYEDFLGIMMDFQQAKIDVPTVVERAKKVFNGDQELINGLEQFLPEGQTLA